MVVSSLHRCQRRHVLLAKRRDLVRSSVYIKDLCLYSLCGLASEPWRAKARLRHVGFLFWNPRGASLFLDSSLEPLGWPRTRAGKPLEGTQLSDISIPKRGGCGCRGQHLEHGVQRAADALVPTQDPPLCTLGVLRRDTAGQCQEPRSKNGLWPAASEHLVCEFCQCRSSFLILKEKVLRRHGAFVLSPFSKVVSPGRPFPPLTESLASCSASRPFFFLFFTPPPKVHISKALAWSL